VSSNLKFHRVGIVTGAAIERNRLIANGAGAGFEIACSGADAARAGACARGLIEAGADALLSIGLAGGLDPRLGPGAIILADRVLTWSGPPPTARQPSLSEQLASAFTVRGRARQFDSATVGAGEGGGEDAGPISAPLLEALHIIAGSRAFTGALLGIGQPVRTPREKMSLFAATRALGVDLESDKVARAAAEAKVPFAALRIVSDPCNRSLPDCVVRSIGPSGELRYGPIIGGLLLRPWELADFVSLAFDSAIALRRLGRVGARLGFALLGA
jgi:adenosylhomocysteine nucleosidase